MSNLARMTVIAFAAISMTGCYAYHERGKALVGGLDVDQTLEVASLEMQDNKFSTVLTVWALRDQIMTAEQATVVNNLYIEHIDRIDSEAQKSREFSVWHLTWAISNMYRLGDEGVKEALLPSYVDARQRVKDLDRRVAKKVFFDDEMLMGDIHSGGRAYARNHLVAPGNEDYLQSVDEYLEERESEAD